MIANRPMYRQTAATRPSGRAQRKWGLLLSSCLVALVGCSSAGSESQASVKTAAGAVDLRQTLVDQRKAEVRLNPPAPTTEPVRLIVPPEAREAVVRAREAMQAKQWDRLRSLIPEADRDPVLGSYVRYWSLRQRLQDAAQPIPQAEIEAFLARNQDAYLADRLKRDWMIAAGRAGDWEQVLALTPIVVEDAQSRCTRLMAQHMSGRKVRAADAVEAFEPNSACWTMLDQLYERRVLGWSDMQGLLRASLETNRHANSRRLAAIMFDGAQMRDYAALMDNPRKWLENRKVVANPAQLELLAIALSRLAYGDKRLENAAWVEKHWEKAMPRPYMEWVWSQFGLV